MHRAEINLLLNVFTDRSVEFIRCIYGGTSWSCMSDSSEYFFRSSDTSLSIMCRFVVNP